MFYLQYFFVEEWVALSEAVTLGCNSCQSFLLSLWMTLFPLRLLLLWFSSWDLWEHKRQAAESEATGQQLGDNRNLCILAFQKHPRLHCRTVVRALCYSEESDSYIVISNWSFLQFEWTPMCPWVFLFHCQELAGFRLIVYSQLTWLHVALWWTGFCSTPPSLNDCWDWLQLPVILTMMYLTEEEWISILYFFYI